MLTKAEGLKTLRRHTRAWTLHVAEVDGALWYTNHHYAAPVNNHVRNLFGGDPAPGSYTVSSKGTVRISPGAFPIHKLIPPDSTVWDTILPIPAPGLKHCQVTLTMAAGTLCRLYGDPTAPVILNSDYVEWLEETAAITTWCRQGTDAKHSKPVAGFTAGNTLSALLMPIRDV